MRCDDTCQRAQPWNIQSTNNVAALGIGSWGGNEELVYNWCLRLLEYLFLLRVFCFFGFLDGPPLANRHLDPTHISAHLSTSRPSVDLAGSTVTVGAGQNEMSTAGVEDHGEGFGRVAHLS